jgi:hypothetical protein
MVAAYFIDTRGRFDSNDGFSDWFTSTLNPYHATTYDSPDEAMAWRDKFIGESGDVYYIPINEEMDNMRVSLTDLEN